MDKVWRDLIKSCLCEHAKNDKSSSRYTDKTQNVWFLGIFQNLIKSYVPIGSKKVLRGFLIPYNNSAARSSLSSFVCSPLIKTVKTCRCRTVTTAKCFSLHSCVSELILLTLKRCRNYTANDWREKTWKLHSSAWKRRKTKDVISQWDFALCVRFMGPPISGDLKALKY